MGQWVEARKHYRTAPAALEASGGEIVKLLSLRAENYHYRPENRCRTATLKEFAVQQPSRKAAKTQDLKELLPDLEIRMVCPETPVDF
jgi:hypothetical protein